MATTFKLYQSGATDGAVYIDMPISGRITSVNFSIHLTAGAGGIGISNTELSRQAVNQTTTSNPRGVICAAYCSTGAASTASTTNVAFFPNEPVKSGERLYLNSAGGASNVSALFSSVWITVG